MLILFQLIKPARVAEAFLLLYEASLTTVSLLGGLQNTVGMARLSKSK